MPQRREFSLSLQFAPGIHRWVGRAMRPAGEQIRFIALGVRLHTQTRGVLITLAVFIMQGSAAADSIIGRASVIDGDTIEIHGTRIRLDGIDAPESWQTCTDAAGTEYRCGKVAAEALDAFLAASRPTHCREVDRDSYRRVVAICTRADGVEVNAWLVRSGHALDWPRYSKGKYQRDQEAAARAKRGIWIGWFEYPWVERARRK